MLPVELALRTATAAIFLITGLVMLRDRRGVESGPVGGLLALSVAAVAIVSIPGIRVWPWFSPLLLVAMGTPALMWIWVGVVFIDDFRVSWRDGLTWLVLPLVAVVGLASDRPWVWTAGDALSLVFVLLAAWRIAAGLRGDLVERRRRLRPVLAILAVLYAGGLILLNALSPDRPAGAGSRLAEAAVLLAFAVAFALVALRAGRPLFSPPVAEPAGPAPGDALRPQTEADPQEDALLARLRQLMEDEKAYRREGFGVATLVAALDVPEYRLRRLINQRLGHRNFSSFVNGYRLAEVTAALADPGQADVPILTIALDAGFQSIGPFNRAFKAHTGMTPTAWRKQAESRAESRSDRPIRGIGQPGTEIGET
jgi:AraC-like DNA-binding protein